MTDKQPEALRLADALDERRVTRWVHATGDTPRAAGYAVDVECAQAAAELRRLHEVNAELVEALEYVIKGVPSTWTGVTKAQIVLEKLKGNNNG
jgi:hypothetical protein